MTNMQPWSRFSDHRCRYMGQGVTCEKAADGGTLCSDGTYHKPGCPDLPPVRAEEAERGIPTTALVVGIGGAAAVAAILLLAR